MTAKMKTIRENGVLNNKDESAVKYRLSASHRVKTTVVVWVETDIPALPVSLVTQVGRKYCPMRKLSRKLVVLSRNTSNPQVVVSGQDSRTAVDLEMTVAVDLGVHSPNDFV